MSNEEKCAAMWNDIETVCQQQVREVRERDEHFRQQILDVLKEMDGEVDWNFHLVIEQDPDAAPGVRKLRFQWHSDDEIPQWFREGISGFQKSISES